MENPIKLLTATTFALGLALAGPALAQNTSAPKAGMTTGAVNAQAGQANFGAVISTLNNAKAEVREIKALNNLTASDVRVVSIDDTLKANNVEALNNALSKNEAEVKNLRTTIEGNKAIVSALSQNNVEVSDVVAADVSGNSVTIYARN